MDGTSQDRPGVNVVEARIRPDGLVDAVHSTRAGGPLACAVAGPRIVELDGLPLTDGSAPGSQALFHPSNMWSGGFSFVAWDPSTGLLHAYRDHCGARPLYYHRAGDRLHLSGALPALVASLPVPPPLDEAAPLEYLATGFLTGSRTFHRGVFRVPPASRLTVRAGVATVERYWRPWRGPFAGTPEPGALAERFNWLFSRAVRNTLHESPPAAFLLSGGADSSAVVGMAARLSREGVPSCGSGSLALTMAFEKVTGCDETRIAEATAAMHGLRWRPVRVERISPFHSMERFLERFGEPPCTVNLALERRLFEAVREEGIGIVLDGHDADALFTPSGHYLSELLRRFRWGRLSRELFHLWFRHHLGPARLARFTMAPLAPAFLRGRGRRVPTWIREYAARRVDLERRLTPAQCGSSFEEQEAERAFPPSAGLALEATRCLERETKVEGRHPFFEPELMRFLLSVPLEHRFGLGETKILLRRAMSDSLAPAVRGRSDKTSYTSYFDWSLREHLGEKLRALGQRGSPYLEDFVDWDRARPMVRSFLEGDGASRQAVWRMLVLERWLMCRDGESLEGRCA